jgi:hypothetical protein
MEQEYHNLFVWNDFGFVVMFSVFLQHQEMIVWLWGTTFYSPNAIPTKALKDLHTIVGDNKISIDGFSHMKNDDWLIGVVALAIFRWEKFIRSC